MTEKRGGHVVVKPFRTPTQKFGEGAPVAPGDLPPGEFERWAAKGHIEPVPDATPAPEPASAGVADPAPPADGGDARPRRGRG